MGKGSVYRQKFWVCKTEGKRLSRADQRQACLAAGHKLKREPFGNYVIAYHDGKKRRLERTDTTVHADAVKALSLRTGAIAKGERVVIQKPLTFDDAVAEVVKDYRINGRRSLVVLTRRIDKHLTPFFSGKLLADIDTSLIRAYIDKRQAKTFLVRPAQAVLLDDGTVKEVPEERRTYSNGEINRELTVLSRMFTLATQDGKIHSRPYMPKLKESAARSGFFEQAGVAAVRDVLDPHYRNIVGVAYATGWRIPSEVLPLRWSHVDFESGEVRLDAGTTKSGEPRVFPMTADLRRVLEAQKALTGERALVFCHLVGKRAGKPIRYNGWIKAWRRACQSAGLTNIPHDFRRSAIRNLERAGVAQSTAMMMVGHKTASVYRRYAIVDSSVLREAAAKIDRMLHQPAAPSENLQSK